MKIFLSSLAFQHVQNIKYVICNFDLHFNFLFCLFVFRYKELIKDSDGPEYKLYMFDEELKGFTFILITSDASPPQELQDKFYNIIVEG